MIDGAFVENFRRAVTSAALQLERISDEEAGRPLAPGKWSRKQIVGHLIDSASNNHGRFVRAQLQDDLVFAGYDQDAWVRLQRYDACRWHALVELWTAYNEQLAHVMESIDSSALERPRIRHNLDEIAFEPVAADRPATLEYLMRDYVAHLRHHLGQLLPAAQAGV